MYETVCLVNPPWVQRERSIWQKVEGATIPFGLGYLAAVLERDSDAHVSIVDAKAENLTLEKTVKHILRISPDVVGIGTRTYDYTDGLTLASMIKEDSPDTVICFGGSHATALPEDVLNNSCVDLVVRGEGEYTFLDTVKVSPVTRSKGYPTRAKAE